MSDELLPGGANAAVQGTKLDVALESVDAADVVSGTPVQGVAELGTLAGTEVGIWELRDAEGGTAVTTDTEVDELFVVLSGGATVELLDENRTVEVGAGDIMRLVAGSRTRWTVKDHIRKVYIAEA